MYFYGQIETQGCAAVHHMRKEARQDGEGKAGAALDFSFGNPFRWQAAKESYVVCKCGGL